MVQKNYYKLIGYAAAWGALATAAVLAGCSADPESDSLGSCSLSCSGARVGSADFTVRPLFQETSIDIACVADFVAAKSRLVPLNGPVLVKYQVVSNTSIFTGGGIPGKGSGSGSGATLTEAETREIPRSGIGFEPYVAGILDIGKTNPEHLNKNGTVTPFKFGGIVTPSTEWCSDSCGVITYEVWPDCVEGVTNKVVAGVIVGGAKPPPSYKITVSNSGSGQ